MPDEALRDLTDGQTEPPQDYIAPPVDSELSHPEFTGCYDVMEELKLWLQESITRHSNGEQVQWFVSGMAFPDPNNRGQFFPGLVISMSIKGAVAGTSIYQTATEQPFGLNREQVDQGCKAWLAELFNARSQQLANIDQQAALAQAQETGLRDGPSNGLWTPGG